jgi:ribosomal protein S18 acetylase RimI-like enzyme
MQAGRAQARYHGVRRRNVAVGHDGSSLRSTLPPAIPLPDPIRSFLYAYEALGQTVVRTPWGLIATDARYPDIYDANKAVVLEAAPALTLQDVRRELIPMLDAAAIGFEHLEFTCIADPMPALAEAEAVCGRSRPDAVMAFDLDDIPNPTSLSSAVVEEVEAPDEAFWRAWIDSRPEFGIEMPRGVLDQLLAGDRDRFDGGWMRVFAAQLHGRLAGFCSLASMEGAGYLDSVVTLREHRRLGVASATVCAAVRASRRAGDRVTFLLAELDGRPQALYERLGFRTIARANGFTRPRAAHRPAAADDVYL